MVKQEEILLEVDSLARDADFRIGICAGRATWCRDAVIRLLNSSDLTVTGRKTLYGNDPLQPQLPPDFLGCNPRLNPFLNSNPFLSP